jgi:hypothetical protein
VALARRCSCPDTKKFTTIDTATTTMPNPRCETSEPTTRWRIASNAITPEPTRIRTPSIMAARFSIFSWP